MAESLTEEICAREVNIMLKRSAVKVDVLSVDLAVGKRPKEWGVFEEFLLYLTDVFNKKGTVGVINAVTGAAESVGMAGDEKRCATRLRQWVRKDQRSKYGALKCPEEPEDELRPASLGRKRPGASS